MSLLVSQWQVLFETSLRIHDSSIFILGYSAMMHDRMMLTAELEQNL